MAFDPSDPASAHQEWLRYAAQKQNEQQQATDQAAQRQADIQQMAMTEKLSTNPYFAKAYSDAQNSIVGGDRRFANQYAFNQGLKALGERGITQDQILFNERVPENQKFASQEQTSRMNARVPVEVQGLRNQGELATEKIRANTQKYGYDTNFDIHKYVADTNERIAGFRYPPGKTGGDTLSQADLAKAVIDWYDKNPVLPGQQQRPFKDVAREIREGLIPVEPPPLPGAEEKSAVQGLVAPSPTASLVGPQQQYNHGQNAIPTRTARWQDSVSPESAASLTDSQWQQYGRGQGATLNRMVPGIQNDQIAEFRRPDGTRLFANTAAVQDTLNRQIAGTDDLVYRPTQEDLRRHAVLGDNFFGTRINQPPVQPSVQPPVQPPVQPSVQPPVQSSAVGTSKMTTPASTRKGVLPPQDPNTQLGGSTPGTQLAPENVNTQLGGGIKQRILANNPGMQPAFETVDNAASSYQKWIDDISTRNRKKKPVDLSGLITSGIPFLTNKPRANDMIDSYRWFHNRR